MRCAQCHGAMVVDHFLDLEDAGGHLWLRAWRCVNCRVIVEPGIFRRRHMHRSLLARLHARFSKRPARHTETVSLGI